MSRVRAEGKTKLTPDPCSLAQHESVLPQRTAAGGEGCILATITPTFSIFLICRPQRIFHGNSDNVMSMAAENA